MCKRNHEYTFYIACKPACTYIVRINLYICLWWSKCQDNLKTLPSTVLYLQRWYHKKSFFEFLQLFKYLTRSMSRFSSFHLLESFKSLLVSYDIKQNWDKIVNSVILFVIQICNFDHPVKRFQKHVVFTIEMTQWQDAHCFNLLV